MVQKRSVPVASPAVYMLSPIAHQLKGILSKPCNQGQMLSWSRANAYAGVNAIAFQHTMSHVVLDFNLIHKPSEYFQDPFQASYQLNACK